MSASLSHPHRVSSRQDECARRKKLSLINWKMNFWNDNQNWILRIMNCISFLETWTRLEPLNRIIKITSQKTEGLIKVIKQENRTVVTSTERSRTQRIQLRLETTNGAGMKDHRILGIMREMRLVMKIIMITKINTSFIKVKLSNAKFHPKITILSLK